MSLYNLSVFSDIVIDSFSTFNFDSKLSVFNIFPNNEEKIKILLYTIFRYLIKNTITVSYLKKDEVKKCESDKFITNVTLDSKLSTFLNYFILGIVKMTKESFDKEQSDLYQSIQKYLQMEF